MSDSLFETFGEVIASYSRAEAIEDGELVDVTASAAALTGIRYPVAITRAAWAEAVAPAGPTDPRASARLLVVLLLLRSAIKLANGPTDTLSFRVRVRASPDEEASVVALKALCGPGDTPAPVITITLPHED
ncbi:DUF6573 family protein [Myxococcus vastator]|uniref:DUF6573 family protein n=1 Tax=Myxococcus vastator TaxID=2709664 RepID=UPI0013D1667B|nr:DUF6573 family protein [Myxococcus vastator]